MGLSGRSLRLSHPLVRTQSYVCSYLQRRLLGTRVEPCAPKKKEMGFCELGVHAIANEVK